MTLPPEYSNQQYVSFEPIKITLYDNYQNDASTSPYAATEYFEFPRNVCHRIPQQRPAQAGLIPIPFRIYAPSCNVAQPHVSDQSILEQ